MDNDARVQNEIEHEVTKAFDGEMKAGIAKGQLAELQGNEAMNMMMEIAKKAGRIQAAKLVGTFVDSLTVSQLRGLKDSIKGTGITWSKACEVVGISTKTADQYLRLGTSLGDDWVADMRTIGVSVRTLEAARQLPAPVREKLTQGEVIDLEDVGKEQLTRVIKELADEHAEERAEAEKAAKKKDKDLEKSEAKNNELTEKVEVLETENRALSSGLDAGDASTWEQIQAIEKAFVMGIVRIRNTPGMQEMSAMLYNRIAASLLFMEALARDTSMHLATKREEGELAGEDWGFDESRELAQQLAGVDNTEPYPI